MAYQAPFLAEEGNFPALLKNGKTGLSADSISPTHDLMKIVILATLLSSLGALPSSKAASPENLDSFLEPWRARGHFPALAAAVVRGNQTVAIGATGWRKDGGKEMVTLEDKFHIGSCTKSMTATLAARLVEQGKITWRTTIADVFPELKNAMHEDYRAVTLDQLISHRGGVPADLNASFGLPPTRTSA